MMLGLDFLAGPEWLQSNKFGPVDKFSTFLQRGKPFENVEVWYYYFPPKLISMNFSFIPLCIEI